MTITTVRAQPLRMVGVFVLGLLVLSGCEADSPDRAPEPNRSFAFDLLQWGCNHASVRSATEVIEAEGEFCFAALNVENRGDGPRTLDPACQLLVAGEDRYAPHLEVMALDQQSAAAFGEGIRAGQLVEDAALYYDVPKGTNPDALDLHEVCDEPGVRITLDPALRSDRL